MIGSGRDKIETPEQLKKAADTVRRLGLDGLVVCGGDDSNTNAAVLAEYFVAQGASRLIPLQILLSFRPPANRHLLIPCLKLLNQICSLWME